jgi:hypothetical protein
MCAQTADTRASTGRDHLSATAWRYRSKALHPSSYRPFAVTTGNGTTVGCRKAGGLDGAADDFRRPRGRAFSNTAGPCRFLTCDRVARASTLLG